MARLSLYLLLLVGFSVSCFALPQVDVEQNNEIKKLKKNTKTQKRTIAGLKSRISQLQKELANLRKELGGAGNQAAKAAEPEKLDAKTAAEIKKLDAKIADSERSLASLHNAVKAGLDASLVKDKIEKYEKDVAALKKEKKAILSGGKRGPASVEEKEEAAGGVFKFAGTATTKFGYNSAEKKTRFELVEFELGTEMELSKEFTAALVLAGGWNDNSKAFNTFILNAFVQGQLIPEFGFRFGGITLPIADTAEEMEKYWWHTEALGVGLGEDWGVGFQGQLFNEAFEYDITATNGDGIDAQPSGNVGQLEMRLSFRAPFAEGLSAHFYLAENFNTPSWELGGAVGYMLDHAGVSLTMTKVKDDNLSIAIPAHFGILPETLDVSGKFLVVKPESGSNTYTGVFGFGYYPIESVVISPHFILEKADETTYQINLGIQFAME